MTYEINRDEVVRNLETVIAAHGLPEEQRLAAQKRLCELRGEKFESPAQERHSAEDIESRKVLRTRDGFAIKPDPLESVPVYVSPETNARLLADRANLIENLRRLAGNKDIASDLRLAAKTQLANLGETLEERWRMN